MVSHNIQQQMLEEVEEWCKDGVIFSFLIILFRTFSPHSDMKTRNYLESEMIFSVTNLSDVCYFLMDFYNLFCPRNLN